MKTNLNIQMQIKALEAWHGKEKLKTLLGISERHYKRIAEQGWQAKGTWALAKLIGIYYSQIPR